MKKVKKKKTKAQKSNYQKYYPIIIFISILFMSVGYAVINSVNLTISGEAIAQAQSGVYITEVSMLTNVDADTKNSTINTAYQTMLNSEITLSSTNTSSSLTYQITIYNSTDNPYVYTGPIYDENYYSNDSIIFDITNITVNETIEANSYKTFLITFMYESGLTQITNNVLESVISFNFSRKYTITYENITNNNYRTYALENESFNITFTGDIPPNVDVTGVESFEYISPTLYLNNVQSDITITIIEEYAVETYTFNGTSDIINTGIKLFSEKNINRDFEITFTITEMGTNEDFATLLNSMDESGSPWPGFTMRYEMYGSTLRFFTVANGNGSSNSGFYEPTTIKIQRIDNILYYQFDDGEETQFFDFTGMTTTFDTPLTFGASLDGSGNPFRYFQGTLSNISVKFLE